MKTPKGSIYCRTLQHSVSVSESFKIQPWTFGVSAQSKGTIQGSRFSRNMLWKPLKILQEILSDIETLYWWVLQYLEPLQACIQYVVEARKQGTLFDKSC